MKILLSSYFHPKIESMSHCILRTLISMGFKLEIHDWYKFFIPGRIRDHASILHNLDIKRINRSLIKKAKNFKPSILLIVGGFTIYPETIFKIKKLHDIIAINWIADYPRNFDLQLKSSIYYDYFFVSGTDALEIYRKSGQNNGYWLPFACDPKIHKQIDLSIKEKEKYGCDICFVGTNYQERTEILEKLTKYNLGIWGIGWERLPKTSPLKSFIRGGIVRPDEWVKIFNASKIVLNISLKKKNDKTNYNYEIQNKNFSMCNTRVFEILGCGAFQLLDSIHDGMLIFKDKEHLVFYNNYNELEQFLNYYLKYDNQRKKIAYNGWKYVLKNHTYEHRLKKMLSIVSR